MNLSSYIWVQTIQKTHPSSQTLIFSYASDWFLPEGDWCCLNHTFLRLKEGPCYVTTPGESSRASGTILSTCPAFSMRLNLTEVNGIYCRCGYECAQMGHGYGAEGLPEARPAWEACQWHKPADTVPSVSPSTPSIFIPHSYPIHSFVVFSPFHLISQTLCCLFFFNYFFFVVIEEHEVHGAWPTSANCAHAEGMAVGGQTSLHYRNRGINTWRHQPNKRRAQRKLGLRFS